MSSSKVYIEDQLARRAELVSRAEMMENHLSGKDRLLGQWENSKDVTEQGLAELREQIAYIDADIERVRYGGNT